MGRYSIAMLASTVLAHGSPADTFAQELDNSVAETVAIEEIAH